MMKFNRKQREEVVGLGGSSISDQASNGSPSPALRTPEKSRGGGVSSGASTPGGGSKGGGEEKIFVTVRVRPLSAKELLKGDVSDWDCPDDHTIKFKHALPERSPYPASYSFDRVFGPDCPTQRVYEEGAKDVALSSLTGLNSTIFAYGQTSSGKTFTMRGVTETAVRDIYSLIEKNEERNFVLKVSALEIYNEVVKDLLNPDSGPLRLLDDPDRGTVVERLQEEIVRDANHLRQIISICEAQRQVGETSLNDTSSRSHQIIRLTVESTPRIQDAAFANTLIASLNFVDLAGSERASQTQSEGARLKEGCHINRSLLTLSTCIRKLSAGGKGKGHIPYRDSKLTRILQHSLGGNARTAIICTMSPAHTHVEQTRNTLFFATRAKEVTNSAHVNLVVSDKVLVRQLQREVARLEAELRLPESPSSTSSTAEALLTSEALLQAKEEQIRKMEMEMREVIRQRDAAQARLNEVVERMMEAEKQAEQRQKELEQQAKELQEALESPCRLQTPTHKTQGQLPPIPSSCESHEDSASNSSRALVVVRRNLADELEAKQSVRSKGSTLRQSNTVSLMLVQEIRKLEHLQDELGEDASRALETLQKEVECLRLAQAGMNADAAQTIKKLQEEIRIAHATRQASALAREAGGVDPQPPAVIMNNMNKSLRQELTRLQAMGENDRNEACATIATLEEQLESVQKSLDKLVLQEAPAEPPASAEEDAKTPKRKKTVPQTSASGRPRLTAGSPTCSPQSARKRFENNENTPPRGGRDINASPHLADSVSPAQKQRTPVKGGVCDDGQGTMHSKDSMQRRSNSVDIRKMQSLFKTAAEDNIKSIRAYVTELKERVAKLQYQKQLLVCQVLELEANNSNEEDSADEETHVEVAAVVPWSPSAWRKQYETQRMYIVDLWDACHVSLVHRSQFILSFKGDPGDAIYMEVELRRLKWLQENSTTAAFEAAQSGYQSASSEDLFPTPLSAGLMNLKREREMLAKRMRSKVAADVRDKLFNQWGIPVETKQRKLQLCNKIWTDSSDMEHVQDSAEVVALIVNFWKPGNELSKEMFELSFAPQSQTKNPLIAGWNQITSLLNM